MAAKLPALTGTRAQQVAQLAAWIDQQTGSAAAAASGLTGKITYGQEYTLYAEQYPTVSAVQAYESWLLTLAGGAFTQVLGQGLTSGAGDVGTLATGAGQGAAQFSQDVEGNPISRLIAAATGIIGDLESASLWLRIAEVAIGVVLISVGVAKITKAIPVATKIAEAVK